jgi:hypothetical protein
MTATEIYDLYVLQSQNVRRLKQVQDNLVKDINFSIKRNDVFQIEIKTKLLALLYCTLSEAQYIQIVHTPNGFSSSEIERIKGGKQKNIEEGWKLLLDLAMDKVGDWNNVPDLLAKRDRLWKVISEFIIAPSLLRNKIAHGQWEFALNRNNDAENKELTIQLKSLNVVDIIKGFNVHQYLALIIRDLVQSPRKGFHNNYWSNLTSMEQYLIKTKDWNLETKKALLKLKPIIKSV